MSTSIHQLKKELFEKTWLVTQQLKSISLKTILSNFFPFLGEEAGKNAGVANIGIAKIQMYRRFPQIKQNIAPLTSFFPVSG